MDTVSCLLLNVSIRFCPVASRTHIAMETLIYPFKPQIDDLEAFVLLSSVSLGGFL